MKTDLLIPQTTLSLVEHSLRFKDHCVAGGRRGVVCLRAQEEHQAQTSFKF